MAAIQSRFLSSGVDATIGGGGGTENVSAEAAAANLDDARACADRRHARAPSAQKLARSASTQALLLGLGAAGTCPRAAWGSFAARAQAAAGDSLRIISGRPPH